MILDEILAAKRGEVSRDRRRVPEAGLRERAGFDEPRRDFVGALSSGQGRRIIAEIKHRSPSRGVIRENFDPPAHAAAYDAAGAACISVLTDESYFGGSLEHLEAARSACDCPLLRKDFTIDEYQIVQARAWGADAILLIVAALDAAQLADLHARAKAEGLAVLVEVHDRPELEVALGLGADLIGINNRDLRTFVTHTDVTRELAGAVPQQAVLVSESGLGRGEELTELESLAGRGVDAFLIGETFMAAADPGEALATLLRG